MVMDERDWKKVIDQMRKELMLVNERITRPDTPHELLYHYTGPDGLLGILNSGAFRLSHCQYLNDPEEVVAGSKLVDDTLAAVAANSGEESGQSWFARTAREQFRRSKLIDHDIFVGSFSELGDDLSQWRAYGANGSGYSIGMRAQVANKPAHMVDDAWLVKCSYDWEQNRIDIEEMVHWCANVFVKYLETYATQCKTFESAATELYEKISVPMLVAIAGRVIRHKSEHYKAEAEWRIYQVMAPDVRGVIRFRTSATGLIPFTEFRALDGDDRSTIERIYVGPSADQNLRVAAAKRLVAELGIDCQVEPSRIAYRGGGGRSR
jgi:hypothetical protein